MPQKWEWGRKWKSIWKEFGRNIYEICPFLTHSYWIPTCASDAGAVAGTDYRWARDRKWQGWRTRLPTDRRTESQSWSADLIEKLLFYCHVFLLLFTVFPSSRPLFGKPFLSCFWDGFSSKPWGDAQDSQQIQLTMELQETGDTKTDQLLRKANLCESQPEPQEVQELEHQEKLPDVKNTEKVTGWWFKEPSILFQIGRVSIIIVIIYIYIGTFWLKVVWLSKISSCVVNGLTAAGPCYTKIRQGACTWDSTSRTCYSGDPTRAEWNGFQWLLGRLINCAPEPSWFVQSSVSSMLIWWLRFQGLNIL